MKYTETYKVMSQFTDANGILRLGSLIRYMQETAKNEMAEDKPSYDELWERGYSFIITRLSVSIYADIFANDIIEIESWAGDSTRYTYPRYYRALRDGKTVAEASSSWALIDRAKGRLVRSGDVELGYRTDKPTELDIDTRPRMPEEMSLVGERTVYYSDIDRNLHMNNTVYADMICDFTISGKSKRVLSLTLSFINEAPLNQTLKVYRNEDDGNFYIKTLREDAKTNIEAVLTTEDI